VTKKDKRGHGEALGARVGEWLQQLTGQEVINLLSFLFL
jgi:hypothetical protein